MESKNLVDCVAIPTVSLVCNDAIIIMPRMALKSCKLVIADEAKELKIPYSSKTIQAVIKMVLHNSLCSEGYTITDLWEVYRFGKEYKYKLLTDKLASYFEERATVNDIISIDLLKLYLAPDDYIPAFTIAAKNISLLARSSITGMICYNQINCIKLCCEHSHPSDLTAIHHGDRQSCTYYVKNGLPIAADAITNHCCRHQSYDARISNITLLKHKFDNICEKMPILAMRLVMREVVVPILPS